MLSFFSLSLFPSLFALFIFFFLLAGYLEGFILVGKFGGKSFRILGLDDRALSGMV